MRIEVDIPDGRCGQWAVESFEIDKEQADSFNLRCLFQGHSRTVTPGSYKRLVRYDECSGESIVVMSNTPAEVRDHWPFIWQAKRSEHILINGLGLGVALKAILESNTPKYIMVVEKEIDVISLVAPHIKDDRVHIRHADAFTFKPPTKLRFGAVWHDIWDSISEENLPEMTKLHRRYGHKTDWQGSWAKYECKRLTT